MKLARLDLDGSPRVAVLDGRALRLAPRDHPDDLLIAMRGVRAGDSTDWEPLDASALDGGHGLRFLAPLTAPRKIVAVGLNYADHTTETGIAQPERPLTFAKYASSITGPYDDIVVPDHLTDQVDYEVELAVVIGERCGGSSPATLAHVAGYTVANDVSARDVQFADGQWTRAKSFDTFTPLGPWLVTPDSFGVTDGHRIALRVGDQVLQEDSTASMLFDVPALLAFIGDGTTLEPGDLILTGTPAGAGGFRTPPRFLAHDELVTASVDGIGELRNRVVFRSRH